VSRSENKVNPRDQSAGKFVQSEGKHQLMTDSKDASRLNDGSSIEMSVDEGMEPSAAFLKRLERAGPHFMDESGQGTLNMDNLV
jgi:hypothetical protein